MTDITGSSPDPKSFNNPNRKTIGVDDIENLGLAVLTLSRELWVMRDRISVLEAVLEKKGIDVRDEIEKFQPDEAMQKDLDEQGRIIVENVLAALKGN